MRDSLAIDSMATSRVPNRYVARADLIALLDRLFTEEYTVAVMQFTQNKS